MRVKFNSSLGIDDARACNIKHGTSIDPKQCLEGSVVDLPEEAVAFLGERYKSLVEPVGAKIKAVPPAPAIGSTDK